MPVQGSLVVIVALLSAVVGCGIDGAATPPEAEMDEAEVTSTRWFDCNASDHNDQLQRVEVGMSATKLQLTDVSKDSAPPDEGTLDRNYNPTPAYAGAIRFRGFPKLVDLWDEVASVDVIVSTEIQNSAAQGKIWMRTAGGGGGGTTSYWCKSKPKKFTVDTSRRSRLACNLKLLCVDDNPPGSTCLDAAFINQSTDSGATLRTTYLDHFGVHVEVRQVNVGASTHLDRTTRTFEAAWGGHQVEVTDRAGVTYVGTFKLPDGRATEAQCNDLAMFD